MNIDKAIEELLEDMWDYGFNSNGDFPTEHQGKYKRVDEAAAKLKALVREARLDELEKHAAVTTNVLDAEECMKLLAAHYFERKKALATAHTEGEK